MDGTATAKGGRPATAAPFALPATVLVVAIASTLLPGGVRAETITFEGDDGIIIVRGRDAGGDARYEFLAEGESRLQCVALDASGGPLAVETTYTESGFVRFQELDIKVVAKVLCRRQN